MSVANCSKYDQLLEQARRSAKYWIPKLCEALKSENPEMSNDDIRERVTQDCIPIWQKSTIRDALTDEYKQKEKAQAGREGRRRQLEQAGGTLTITGEPEVPVKLRAENGSDSSTGQKSQTFNRSDPEEMVGHLQSQLNSTKQEQQETKNEGAAIQGGQGKNIKDVPDLGSEQIGLIIKADPVSRMSKTERRDLSLYLCGWGEQTKKIASQGEAMLEFYKIIRHKRTKLGYLVPVKFMVDFTRKTTSFVLDESRD
jgi:hypothetical protein